MGEARSIFVNACRQIAEEFQKDGFRFMASKLLLAKKESDLTFHLRFQSSHLNAVLTQDRSEEKDEIDPFSLFSSLETELAEITTHGNVSLLVHAEVRGQSMKAWRTQLTHPVRTDDGMAGTNLGYLAPQKRWLEVNLANPHTRSAQVAAVIQLIKDVALPYFEEFHDPPRVLAALLHTRNPGMAGTLDLEYAACYGSREVASGVLQRHLEEASGSFYAEYQESLREFRHSKLPAPNTVMANGATHLAFAALALGLEVVSTDRQN